MKKFICIFCALTMLFSLMPFDAIAATVLNEDVSIETPINGNMETQAEITAVDGQLVGPNSVAALSDDKVDGKHSLRVTSVGQSETYTMVNSDTFDINRFSTVELWVKPGVGASWVKFYTNSTLITCDKNGDGSFEVGTDLVGGKWNKVTLNLLSTASAITTGDDLAAESNANSVWLFDQVKSQNTAVTNLDLSGMVNGNTRINNGSLEFALNTDGTTFTAASCVLTSANNTAYSSPLRGMLAGISIDSGFSDVSGASATPTYTVPASVGSIYDITNDGKYIYYSNANAAKKIYRFDVETGVNSFVADYVPEYMAVSPNGNYLAFATSSNIYRIDLITSTTTNVASGSLIYSVCINNAGNILWGKYGYDYYLNGTYVCSISASGGRVGDIIDDIGNSIYVCAHKRSASFVYITTPKTTVAANSEITSTGINRMESGVFYTTSSGIYLYTISTAATRKLNSSTYTILKVLDNDKLLLSGGHIYDPATDTMTTLSVTPVDSDSTGNILQTSSSIVYLDQESRSNKYLLSFDGKNTWYSYQGGVWTKVCTGNTPTKADMLSYGMTAAEVNALTKADFAPLYENGNEIYSVDVATLMISGSLTETPSIKSIKVITDREDCVSASGDTAYPIYAAKSTAFLGSRWYQVNRIYPVEICPKEASYLYFIYANGKYQYYNGSQWVTETGTEIADLIADTESNWTALNAIGMSAAELRQIPQAALTAQLAGKDFSVVYCMKVADRSTVSYNSKITVDYTEDLFTGTTYKLTITLDNGTVKTFTDLTDAQAENFMAWLNGKHTGTGQAFYRLADGTGSYFVNYYVIQSVSVEAN